MTRKDTIHSYAKINLSLDVLGKREDGYHDLKMVMQSVSLCDTMEVEWNDSGRVQLVSNLSYLPTGEKNLVSKATQIFYQHLGKPVEGMHISMMKQIPVCAGLAGGSGNGAAILKLLHSYHDFPFSQEKLLEIGEEVGADVPYCILGGTALAERKGEQLTPLPSLPFCYIVLCKPNFSIATPELFQKIDTIRLKHRPQTTQLLKALEVGDLGGVACRMFNVFEEALNPRQQKVVNEIKTIFLNEGALGASMSGSGPTVIGMFQNEEMAKHTVALLKQTYRETFLTKPV